MQTLSSTLSGPALVVMMDRFVSDGGLVYDLVLDDRFATSIRGPIAPEHHGQEQSDRADDHQDHADHVQIDTSRARFDGERKDGTDRHQEDADAYAHGSPPFDLGFLPLGSKA
jgi:hypothetical protein